MSAKNRPRQGAQGLRVDVKTGGAMPFNARNPAESQNISYRLGNGGLITPATPPTGANLPLEP